MISHVPKKRKLDRPLNDVVFEDNDRLESSPSRVRVNAPSGTVQPALHTTGAMSNHGVSASRKLAEHDRSFALGDMYNSDMFQIQLGELLESVRPNYTKQMARVESVLHELKQAIEDIPARPALPITEADRVFHQESEIAIPWSDPIQHLKYSVAYVKPDSINVVGSFVLKSALQSGSPPVVDMTVTIPSSIFQEKDYLNYRYFNKRAYYLACIATGIETAKNCDFQIQYEYQSENNLQPVLLLSPTNAGQTEGNSKASYQVRLLIAINSTAFPVLKTLPWKCCIRSLSSNTDMAKRKISPSPLYNATIRAEASTATYLKLLHAATAQAEGFRDACILGAVWLRQRGLATAMSKGGFGSFEFACITALLLQGGGPKGRPLLSAGYSRYQMFKASLQFLAATDLVKTPLVIGDNPVIDMANTRTSTPIFLDATVGLNLLFKMTPWSYKMLQHEVRVTLALLNGTVSDRFNPTFISRVDDIMQKFDTIIKVIKTSSIRPDAREGVVQYCEKLYRILSTGLGDRVKLIYPMTSASPPWPITAPCPSEAETQMVVVGMLTNPEQVSRAVDRGPSAEDTKAAVAFRKFWGERAELRRFQDGSILESLIWTEKRHSRSILQQIIWYIIERHMDASTVGSIYPVAEDFDTILPGDRPIGGMFLAGFQPISHAFESLAKEMRNLEGMPLQIRQVSASSAALRYASILPKSRISNDRAEQPIDITLQFEGSHRWPEDITSIQVTKIAFLLKLGDLLEEKVTGMNARLGLENETPCLLNTSFLDIFYPDVAVFRLRIHHESELRLLERQAKDKSADHYSREEAASAVAYHKRLFIHSHSHTQMLSTLCVRFPHLSPCIRLLKYWCSSHLLSLHVRPELIELLAVRTFTSPYPWTAPGSIRTAFLRTLAFIAKWDWRSEPLIVHIGNSMTGKDVDAINTRFEAWRRVDSAMNRVIMFVASDLDPEGIVWTERVPSKLVAARLSNLAQAACRLVKEQGLEIDVKSLFASSVGDYDFVIHVDPRFHDEALPKMKASMYKNLQVQDVRESTQVGYDAVQLFIEELQRMYRNNIVLFYNEGTKSVIAGLWNPQAGPRPWKVNLAYSTVPSSPVGDGARDTEFQVTINKTAILNDIARLGGSLVSKIDVKKTG